MYRTPGPLCVSQVGSHWIDAGTLCLNRSPTPTPLGMDDEFPEWAVAEDSGPEWVSRFPTSTAIADCGSPFKERLQAFVDALLAAGASVSIAATRRPAQRAYLMHWSWKLTNGLATPTTVPPRPDVVINWAHGPRGVYSAAASLAAAQAMVRGYGMSGLKVAPALKSHHIAGLAVDMTIHWGGTLTIRNAREQVVNIATSPRDGMNEQLHEVGASYGVIKYHGGTKDRPHWSIDGR